MLTGVCGRYFGSFKIVVVTRRCMNCVTIRPKDHRLEMVEMSCKTLCVFLLSQCQLDMKSMAHCVDVNVSNSWLDIATSVLLYPVVMNTAHYASA